MLLSPKRESPTHILPAPSLYEPRLMRIARKIEIETVNREDDQTCLDITVAVLRSELRGLLDAAEDHLKYATQKTDDQLSEEVSKWKR